jgi:hypothetical protein
MVRQLHHCGITIVGSRSGSGACAMPQPYLPAAVSRHLPVLYVVCCMLYALSRPVHVACCAAVARSMEREVRASRSHSIQLAHSSTTSRRALGSCRPYAVHCGYTATVLRTARHRTAPHRTALHGTAPLRAAPHCSGTAWHGTALRCTARHGTARHSIARHINAASEGTARSRSLRCSLPCCSL